MNLKEILSQVEKPLSEGSVFESEYQGFALKARAVEDDAYAIIGRNQDGDVVISEGSAGILNLLIGMDRYGGLEKWTLAES